MSTTTTTGKRKARSSITAVSSSRKREPTISEVISQVADPSDVDVPMNDGDEQHNPWRMLHLYSSEVIALHTRLVARDSEIDYHAAIQSAKQLFSSINQLPVEEQIDEADMSTAVQSNLNTLVEKLIGKQSNNQTNNQSQSKAYTHQRTSLSFMTAQLITNWSSYQIPVGDEEFAKAVVEQTKKAFAPQLKQMREAGLQTPSALASFETALRTVFCNSMGGHSQLERQLFLAANK